MTWSKTMLSGCFGYDAVALAYAGHRLPLRRIAYGQYLVDGAILQTLDEFGLPNTRHEDAYRVDMDNE